MLKDSVSHRTTGRILDILETVSAKTQGYSLSGLCGELKMPKSSIFPLLHTLRERGYLKYNESTMRYQIGAKAFAVGNGYLGACDLMEEVEIMMRQVVDVCQETCHFGALQGGEVLYLKKVDSPQAIRMMSTVGKTLPAYATGLGKALLCDLDMSALKKLYYAGLVAMTEHTIIDLNQLARQLEQVKREGFAYEVEESNRHVRCIAVPIRKKGVVAASFSVAVPVFRYSQALAEQIKECLRKAADEAELLFANMELPF